MQRYVAYIVLIAFTLIGVALYYSTSPEEALPPDPEEAPAITRPATPEGLIDQLLQAIEEGDYEVYRQSLTRLRQPEPPERFEAMRAGLRAAELERLVEVDPDRFAAIEPPVYAAALRVELDPNSVLAKHGDAGLLRLLIFREDNHWCFMPAPEGWRPEGPVNTAPTTQETPDRPEYPWDENVDY